MPRSILDVMWEQEMLAINDRLTVVAGRFRRIIEWADSDAGLLDVRRWPEAGSLHDLDQQLLKHLIQVWLPRVNEFIQRGTTALIDEQAVASFYVEDVVLMRPASDQEILSILESVQEPIEFVIGRAEQLMGFHQAVAKKTGESEGWKGLQAMQEKYARLNFPRLLPTDAKLLKELLGWRARIHEKLVNPYLETASRQSDGSQESVTQIMLAAIRIAQGPAAA